MEGILENIDDIAEKSTKDTLEMIASQEGRTLRGSNQEKIGSMTVDDFMARLTPVFSTCVTVSLKETLKAVLHPLINIQKEEKKKCREKLIEQRLICDRLDAQNRQSNVLVIGQEEPSSNFTSNGFESQVNFENVLKNIANKVSAPVSTQDIDFAH